MSSYLYYADTCNYISVAVVFFKKQNSLCRNRDNSGYTTCICYLPSNFILLYTMLLVLKSSCFGCFFFVKSLIFKFGEKEIKI